MTEKRKGETATAPKKAPDRREQARRRRVRALRGKYAFVPTSSEEFARRKQIEITLER
jgi:hypothetical protein